MNPAVLAPLELGRRVPEPPDLFVKFFGFVDELPRGATLGYEPRPSGEVRFTLFDQGRKSARRRI